MPTGLTQSRQEQFRQQEAERLGIRTLEQKQQEAISLQQKLLGRQPTAEEIRRPETFIERTTDIIDGIPQVAFFSQETGQKATLQQQRELRGLAEKQRV